MSEIPKRYVESYANALDKLSGKAKEMLRRAVSQIDFSDVAKGREQVVIAMQTLIGAFSTYSSVTACEFYDLLRKLAGERTKFDALTFDTYGTDSLESSVRFLVGDIVAAQEQAAHETDKAAKKSVLTAGTAKLLKNLESRIDYEIRHAAGETILGNVRKDPAKPRFARIPSGADTCEFCIMLASQGFVYHSEETAGKHKHYHANCRCVITPGFKGQNGVEGYDPDAYYRQWRDNERQREDKGLETMSAKGARLQRERKQGS